LLERLLLVNVADDTGSVNPEQTGTQGRQHAVLS
jgi:hypothetical protein